MEKPDGLNEPPDMVAAFVTLEDILTRLEKAISSLALVASALSARFASRNRLPNKPAVQRNPNDTIAKVRLMLTEGEGRVKLRDIHTRLFKRSTSEEVRTWLTENFVAAGLAALVPDSRRSFWLEAVDPPAPAIGKEGGVI